MRGPMGGQHSLSPIFTIPIFRSANGRPAFTIPNFHYPQFWVLKKYVKSCTDGKSIICFLRAKNKSSTRAEGDTVQTKSTVFKYILGVARCAICLLWKKQHRC